MGKRIIRQFIIFGMVGGIATVLDFLFFNLIFLMTSLFVFSRIIGIAISMLWNFNANLYITFKASDGNIKKQLVRYLIVYGIAMGSNTLVSWIVFNYLGPGRLNANIAAASGLLISIPLAFIGSKLWVFRIEKNKKRGDLRKIS